MIARSSLSVFLLLGFSLPARSATLAWPEFRGPDGNGHATESNLPVSINESAVVWETPIHGKGWSSPVVWGDQIWLTTATEDGKKMSAVCVDRASGKVLRDIVVFENNEPEFCHPTNSYASPTPVIESGRVYVHFGTYGTACLDTENGEVIWKQTELHCDHFRGPASSPILNDEKLFVAFDGIDVQYMVAIDKRSGEIAWKKDRNIDYKTEVGDWKKGYGTAQVIKVGEQDHLICPSASATIAYAPETGEEIWRVYHGGMNASARPVYVGGLLLLTNGMGEMVAVKLENAKGDITATHIAWTEKKGIAKKASLIVVEERVYMVSDDGVISCRNLSDGKLYWQKRVGGSFAASPVYADGRLYFFSSEGRTYTIKPSDQFEQLAEEKLGEGFMASPAVVGDQMILRSKMALYGIGQP